jgi:hypothetical protein
MKEKNHHNKNYQFAVSAWVFIITLSFLWSIISRATNIFFLSNQERLMVTVVILFFSFSTFLLFFLNNNFYKVILRNIKGTGRTFTISILLSSLVAAGLFISNLLPTVSIPFQHQLVIKPLPTDNHVKNIVYIDSIIEMIDAPAIGSNLVDSSEIQATDGIFSINTNEISLHEGAVLTYSSFYSGCVRIIFNTTPESGKVVVQFDNVEQTYSLYSSDEDQSEINLCSKYPLNQLTPKWRIISIGNYFLNIVALTTVFGFELFLVFFKKENTYIKSKKVVSKKKGKND